MFRSKPWLSRLILLAIFSCGGGLPFRQILAAEVEPPVAAPAITIDETNADLSGAGRLSFEGDGDAIAALLPQPGGAELNVRIRFDGNGLPLNCVSEEKGASAKAGEALCSQIVSQARFELIRGFDLPFREGELAITAYVQRVERPVRPIRLLPIVPGNSYILMLAPEGSERPCLLAAPEVLQGDQDAICDAWMKAGRPGLHGRMAQVRVELDRRESSLKPGYVLWTFERLLWKNATILYASRHPVGAVFLKESDGEIAVSVAGDDYPARALREGIEGTVRVLLGFDRLGNVQTCRPIKSSGTPFLDNATCATMLRRAHFNFRQGGSQFLGIRYRETGMRWTIPQD